MKIIIKKIDELIPADYNPRQLSVEQFDKIKESLTRFGFVDPVIVNIHAGREGVIVGGHQRVKVWRSMGNTEVPTVEVELPEEKERELNVRLNKASGEWDWDVLANAFEVDDLIEWGFSEDELQIKEDDPEEEPEIVFSEYLGEKHNYVVLYFDSEIDWLQAETHFNIKTVTSKRANGKPWNTGMGRVINGAKYLKGLKG